MIGLLISASFMKMSSISYTSMIKGIIDSIGDNNITIIDTNSSDKWLKELNKPHMSIIHLPFKDEYESWEVYENVISQKCKDLECLVTFGNPINEGFRHNNYTIVSGYEKARSKGNKTYSLTFNLTKEILCKYNIAKYFATAGRRIIHFIIDPQEFNYAKYFNCGTTVYFMNKSNDMFYVPTYEKILFNKGVYVGKNKDFTFYGTASTKDRAYLLKYRSLLKSILNSDVSVFGDGSPDKLCHQEQYYKKLSHSKYTLIIPSYDVTAFSMIRFFEAVSNYCLPLVLDMCNLTDVKNTFPDIYEFIKKYLVTSIEGIQQKINELNYEDLVFELYKTQTIKNFFDDNYYKNVWNKYIKEN